MKKGFTLMEVLVAFAILSILLTVILQSQGEEVVFTEKTARLEEIRLVLAQELAKIELNFDQMRSSSATGQYEKGHPLEGASWERVAKDELYLGLIAVHVIRFRIHWPEKPEAPSLSSSVWGEAR